MNQLKRLTLNVLLSLGIAMSANSCAHYISQSEAWKKDDNSSIDIVLEEEAFYKWQSRNYKGALFVVEAFSDSEAVAKTDELEEEMSKYPEGFLNSYLRTIFYFDTMNRQGYSYGGHRLNISDGVMITTAPSIFHHEFSSFLFFEHKKDFPKEEWLNINLKFEYDFNISVLDTSKYSNISFAKPELLEQGFIKYYSTTSLENDFNILFKWLYFNPERLFEHSDLYPAIGRKTELTIDFLSNVMGQELDRQYFLDLQE